MDEQIQEIFDDEEMSNLYQDFDINPDESVSQVITETDTVVSSTSIKRKHCVEIFLQTAS